MPPIASAVINMDRCLFHLDANQNKLPEINKKYGAGVEVEIHYPEAHFTMASTMRDVMVEDIIEEFELEPWRDYLNRARKVRERMLKKAAKRILSILAQFSSFQTVPLWCIFNPASLGRYNTE